MKTGKTLKYELGRGVLTPAWNAILRQTSPQAKYPVTSKLLWRSPFDDAIGRCRSVLHKYHKVLLGMRPRFPHTNLHSPRST